MLLIYSDLQIDARLYICNLEFQTKNQEIRCFRPPMFCINLSSVNVRSRLTVVRSRSRSQAQDDHCHLHAHSRSPLSSPELHTTSRDIGVRAQASKS